YHRHYSSIITLTHASQLIPHSSPYYPSESHGTPRDQHSFPTRRSSDLFPKGTDKSAQSRGKATTMGHRNKATFANGTGSIPKVRSEEHTSELQSRRDLVCRLLLEKKKQKRTRRVRRKIEACKHESRIVN